MNSEHAEPGQPITAADDVEIASGTRNILGIGRARAKRPAPSARCSACGSSVLSSVPTFSAGSGVAARPFAEDVICHPCGHIGPPALVPD